MSLIPSWTSLALVTAVPILIKYWRILYIAALTFPRDVQLISRAARYALRLKIYQWRNVTAVYLFEQSVRRHPDKVCFYCGDEVWTYQQVDDLSNKFANLFLSKGYKQGDVVALFMENRPEYPCIWLGLSKFIFAAIGAHDINGVREDDVFLTPLPLYHMADGMLAVGQAFCYGTTVVITKKFSASRFWSDCIRYNVTVTQYLGEICRFLLSQPERPEDKQHKIRLITGNGLRSEIWNEFVTRFNIPKVVEFYGSTEGNCSLANVIGYPGAVGYLPRILMPILPMALVKVDQYTGEPIRDPNTGLAVLCKVNEPGEMMAVIKANNPIRDFPDYTDSSANNKKVLHDIFSKGDAVFRAGDILMMDELGYIYFKDRIGDTFRWKGENVSTMEVEAVISNFCELKDVCVYGVQIPGTDGRAGMAAISDSDGTLDWKRLTEGIVKSLPAYARPIFIRVLDKDAELTGTFKLKKVELQKEGIDVSTIQDKIYIFSNGKYELMSKDTYNNVISGKIRL